MNSVVYWYRTEVYFWRTAGSLFWTVFSVPPLTVIYLLASNFSILHPWLSIINFTSVLCSFTFSVRLLLLVILLLLVAWFSPYTVLPEVKETALQSYLSLLRLSRLLFALVCYICGACVAWCATEFMGPHFSQLTKLIIVPERELLVLNEAHLFIVLSGGVAGLVYYATFHLQHKDYLVFPLLQREKYFRVRSEMLEMVNEILKQVWWHLSIFYLAYFLLGAVFRGWVISILKLNSGDQSYSLDSTLGLLNLELLWQTALLSFFIHYTWNLSAILYGVYHTQHLELPILPSFNSVPRQSLSEALACNSDPLLLHLAFLDLSYLSYHSPARRKEIYSLSQPGGHPHIWRAVCTACLQQLQQFATQLQLANAAALVTIPIQQQSIPKIFSTTGVNSTVDAAKPSQPSSIISLKDKLYSGLKDKPILWFFLLELPEAKSWQLFAASQIHIWAIEGLSQLAAASYEEDKFGVVQQTLPAIFISLLTLQEAVEKHFKLQPIVMRRSLREASLPPYATLRLRLRTVLKTAIYRLTSKFGNNLGDLQLSPEFLKKLRPFQDFKE